jgi:hypothetical protein
MQPIGRAVPGALAELLRNTPLSPGKVEFAWKLAVGPSLERATSVRLEAGRVVVEAVSAEWAQAVARSSPTILARLRSLLGSDVVTRIDVRTRPRVS